MEKLFDGKYNQLIDSAAFRLGMNAAVFAVWLGAAFVLLEVLPKQRRQLPRRRIMSGFVAPAVARNQDLLGHARTLGDDIDAEDVVRGPAGIVDERLPAVVLVLVVKARGQRRGEETSVSRAPHPQPQEANTRNQCCCDRSPHQ